ncbi:MAG TPA: DUF1802 family protein [Thermoanaerobaculia bacterium]|nr:DUF1802 family protein [Thermoanaerobaculia bacterium]
MSVLPNHTALREWASIIEAVSAGRQILLVRKGGIAENGFRVEAQRFYLLPTYLHQKEKQFKTEERRFFSATDRADTNPDHVPVSIWCEVADVFQIRDLDRLIALDPFLIFTSDTIHERYRFRPTEAVHVIAVRGYRLPAAVTVKMRPEYAGCRSWISLEEQIDVAGSEAVLGDGEFSRRLEEVRVSLSNERADASLLK